MTSAAPQPRCRLLTDTAVVDLARAGTIVLDSWHLYDGAGVAVDRHRERFTAHVREVFEIGEEESGSAYDHALAHLPVEGSWFPAFVWTTDGLRLLVRPFPVEQLRQSTTLLLLPTRDARKRPDIKGFDFLSQIYAHRQATEAGYDDQVLATAGGSLSETVFATLILARQGELVVPHAPRLDSVTLAVLRERAGRPVRVAPVTASHLLTAPAIFILSALHGVRVVERVNDTSYQPNPQLREALQTALEGARRPIADLLPGGEPPCASC
ncbi:aminotransferase class IV [Flexivirga alba]|uniref:Aminotransferase class IV n=1 Tax=Flexivirga alba TaxID=702742 RepID=A0ABW2AD37_9MICO